MNSPVIEYNSSTDVYIDSREVSKMLKLRHSDLMKKIVQISKDLRESKSSVSNKWVESTYTVEGNFKSYRCYLITKRGCEFLAHKTNGPKGAMFTEQYMNKFEQMEQELNVPVRTEKELLLLDLFSNDSITIANAHKKLVELETKPLLEIIESQKEDISLVKLLTEDKETLYTVGEVAKILKLGIGQNLFFEQLRELNVLMSGNKHKNEPYQKYVDKGFLQFVVEERGGMVLKVPKFTGEGIRWISNKLNKKAHN